MPYKIFLLIRKGKMNRTLHDISTQNETLCVSRLECIKSMHVEYVFIYNSAKTVVKVHCAFLLVDRKMRSKMSVAFGKIKVCAICNT